jgi:hypothetical protein
MASTLDQFLSAIKRTPGNIAGGPVDVVNLLAGLVAGKGVEGLSKEPVGGSDWINRQFGMKDKGGGVQQVAEMAAGMMSPGGALKAVIVPAVLVKDAATIARARGMQNMGASDGRIFQETGIYSAPGDDILRAVISDEGAKVKYDKVSREVFNSPALRNSPGQFLRMNLFKQVPLKDVLEHPELFAINSKLKDVPVSGLFGSLGSAGYNPSKTADTFGSIKLGSTMSEKEFLRNLLHEVQHGIQEYYKMPMGGNERMFVDSRVPKVLDAIVQELPKAKTKEYADRLEAGRKEAKAMDRMGNQLYLRMAGEAEARAVETALDTRNYTRFPVSMYDVPLRELISPSQVQRLRPSQNLQDLIDSLVP